MVRETPTALEIFAENLSAFISNLFQLIFGSRVLQPILGDAHWGDLLTAILLLTLVLIAAAAARSWMEWFKRSRQQRGEGLEWPAQVVMALAQPAYALIWLYGIYLALVPFLLRAEVPLSAANIRFASAKILHLGVFAIVIWAFYRLTIPLETRLLIAAKKTRSKLDDLLVPPLIKTLRVLLPIVAIILGLPLLGLPAAYDSIISKLTSLILIAAVAWILFQAVRVGENVLLAQYNVEAPDNLEARKIHTQVRVLSKSLYVVILIFTLASMLMVFEEVRRFGTNILASAGVVGIIIGFAAQRTIANLFAGFQLAMTQPIRLDDVVIVENEWGRIEEITLTYVVIKIWDQRRLIVPLSYFIEKPFQNWTRVSADIMGSVFLFTDYTVPVDEIRAEAKRIIENHPNWDKKFWNVQVTEATDRAVQVRVLVTASDSGKAWNMRCDIREQLIAFLQKNYPGALPRVRADLTHPEKTEANENVQGIP